MLKVYYLAPLCICVIFSHIKTFLNRKPNTNNNSHMRKKKTLSAFYAVTTLIRSTAFYFQLLESFIEELFDENPISQVGIIVTSNKRAEKVAELGGKVGLTAQVTGAVKGCSGYKVELF